MCSCIRHGRPQSHLLPLLQPAVASACCRTATAFVLQLLVQAPSSALVAAETATSSGLGSSARRGTAARARTKPGGAASLAGQVNTGAWCCCTVRWQPAGNRPYCGHCCHTVCSKTVDTWGQCGGGTCGSSCDAPWGQTCCKHGDVCTRKDTGWWRCEPEADYYNGNGMWTTVAAAVLRPSSR